MEVNRICIGFTNFLWARWIKFVKSIVVKLRSKKSHWPKIRVKCVWQIRLNFHFCDFSWEKKITMKRTWWFNFSGFVVILVLLLSEQTKKAEALKSVRHGRHRRVSGPDPVVLNSNGRQVKEEQKENKHKPNFERCDDYTPEVLEEEPVGKFLFLLCTNLFVVNSTVFGISTTEMKDFLICAYVVI